MLGRRGLTHDPGFVQVAFGDRCRRAEEQVQLPVCQAGQEHSCCEAVVLPPAQLLRLGRLRYTTLVQFISNVLLVWYTVRHLPDQKGRPSLLEFLPSTEPPCVAIDCFSARCRVSCREFNPGDLTAAVGITAVSTLATSSVPLSNITARRALRCAQASNPKPRRPRVPDRFLLLPWLRWAGLFPPVGEFTQSVRAIHRSPDPSTGCTAWEVDGQLASNGTVGEQRRGALESFKWRSVWSGGRLLSRRVGAAHLPSKVVQADWHPV